MRRLNLFDYKESRLIAAQDYAFYALLAATMRQADTNNLAALTLAFPQVAADLAARYDAPGGRLPGEGQSDD